MHTKVRQLDKAIDTNSMWVGVLPNGRMRPVPQVAKPRHPYTTGFDWLANLFFEETGGALVAIPIQAVDFQHDLFLQGQIVKGERRPIPARAAPRDASGNREVMARGRVYQLAPSDSISLFGALALAVDGQTARVTLASGDTLELTHQDVSDIGRQLAGKPADAVSGQDRPA